MDRGTVTTCASGCVWVYEDLFGLRSHPSGGNRVIKASAKRAAINNTPQVTITSPTHNLLLQCLIWKCSKEHKNATRILSKQVTQAEMTESMCCCFESVRHASMAS